MTADYIIPLHEIPQSLNVTLYSSSIEIYLSGAEYQVVGTSEVTR